MKAILVVEDELSIRSFICLNLRRKKYEVLEAETGERALELFAANPVDVVLLDLMLPGMDGFAVCEKMRDLSPLTGITMLTARSQEEDKIKGLIQGADDYITKPFSMTELEARIISLLRRMDLRSSDQNGTWLCSGPFELDFEHSTIFVDQKKESDLVKITTRDSGTGIKPEDLSYVTRSFYKGEDQSAGEGIGLSISQKIMELHGGKLQIESEYGTGTTVTILIPKNHSAGHL